MSLSQKEDYRKEMNKEMYKKHEEMEYKQPIEPYEERQTYQEDSQGQFQNYKQQESTPNKPDIPGMEFFCNEEELDRNMTNIRKPTDIEDINHQWNDEDSLQQTINEDTTQKQNTRVIFNTKYHKNMPIPRQDHLNRAPQHGNQDKHRFQVPPHNMQRDMVIYEMQRMGINQKSTTQQDLDDQQTNRKAIEEMRQSFIAKEKAIKEGIEAQYRAQIDNLTRENIQQKEANMQNNATSLSKINFQENTIQTLLEERDYYKNQLEKTIQ